MNCEYHKSKEHYYGVAGDVPVMTSGFWECEPDDEEVKDAFLKWMDENGEMLEPSFPDTVSIYCEECDEEFEFNYTPGDVFSKDELWKINTDKLLEWLEEGAIDEEDYLANIQELKQILGRE